MTDLLIRWYRRLLATLPRQFRDDYGDEMAGLLHDLMADQPPRRQLHVFALGLADLVQTVPAQHRAALTETAPRLAPAAGPVTPGPSSPTPTRAGRPGPSRRGFLRAAMAATATALGGGMTSAGVAYLWPRSGAGFGSLIDAGSPTMIAEELSKGGGTYAVPSARAYLVAYDPADDPAGDYAEITGGSGMMALYQKCVHLGCRVPWCGQSSWFECPCHGSQYNRWGEYQAGPAPRGLDRFTVQVSDGRVIVDTRRVVSGPSRSVDTLQEPPRGPHCVDRR